MKTFGELSGKFNLYSKTINTETFELSTLNIYNAEVEGDVVDFPSVRQFVLDGGCRIRININKTKDGISIPIMNGYEFIATSGEALDAAIEKYKENSIKEIKKAIKQWEKEIKMREKLVNKSIKSLEKINKI